MRLAAVTASMVPGGCCVHTIRSALCVCPCQAGDDAVVSALERALDTAGPTLSANSLAIFCHVTSHPALVLPVPRLVEAARSRGVRVLVDGAHALGQVNVDIQALGDPDFYVRHSGCNPRWPHDGATRGRHTTAPRDGVTRRDGALMSQDGSPRAL